MTERTLGDTLTWWIGIVTNATDDPNKSGRVQVRVFGQHDDTQNIPDEDLPWALPIQPVTSAAIGRLGTAPLGLVVGSKVCGFWMDQDQQYPIIWGTIGKAGDYITNKTEGGAEALDTSTGSIPQANNVYFSNNVVEDVNSGKTDVNNVSSAQGQVVDQVVIEELPNSDRSFLYTPDNPIVQATSSMINVGTTITEGNALSLLGDVVSGGINLSIGGVVSGLVGNVGQLVQFNFPAVQSATTVFYQSQAYASEIRNLVGSIQFDAQG